MNSCIRYFLIFFYTAQGALKMGWCREATSKVCTEQPERPKKWGSHRKFPQKMSERPKCHLCFPGTQLAQDNPQLSFHCCIKSRHNPMDLKTISEEKKNTSGSEVNNPLIMNRVTAPHSKHQGSPEIWDRAAPRSFP